MASLQGLKLEILAEGTRTLTRYIMGLSTPASVCPSPRHCGGLLHTLWEHAPVVVGCLFLKPFRHESVPSTPSSGNAAKALKITFRNSS